ncbi:hypothetical protein DUD79_09645 [Priestia aryabhattai]|nr:hypothetical protein COI42_23400 [Priestia aryabhattai]
MPRNTLSSKLRKEMKVNKVEIIKSIKILSDDESYRYQLARVWGEDKPKALVIGNYAKPSKNDMLITGRTVMNITNYLVEIGF